MNDLISRQEAIDLFPNDALEWDTNCGYIAPHFARRMIEELPSAQPEIIRCKERRMRPVDISGMYLNYGRGNGKQYLANMLKDFLMDLPVVDCETCRYYTTQDCPHEDVRSNSDALACRDWNVEER